MKWEVNNWYITIDADIFKIVEIKDFKVRILTKQNGEFVISEHSKGRLDYIFAGGSGIASSYDFNDNVKDDYLKVKKHVNNDVNKARKRI